VIPRDIVELLGAGDWKLAAADGAGSEGRAWVATDGDRKVFVKTGVDVAVLRSVADLGVAPRVVASRNLEAGPTVAQEFVEGVRPEERWVDENVKRVMRLMRSYHAELSLTHGDPNSSNFILARDDRLYLVDWDLARVGDPMRDIGPLLWWYVRPDRWPQALAAADLADGDATRASVHQWAAARSFEVSGWLATRGHAEEAQMFARDGAAARVGLENPRAWWRRA
jgi:aminoglycoside phosphotransferase (APT) family kinase protein